MTMVSPTEARNATAPISELAGCSRLELVARLADGSIRRPSMAETLPFTLLPPEKGMVELLATPEPRFCNPIEGAGEACPGRSGEQRHGKTIRP
jgi:hypothetical protein